jgi:CRISPR-associated protein Cas2
VIVIVLTAVPRRLRGELTRWLMEVSPGVFCGRASRRVREKLWERVLYGLKDGSAVMVTVKRDREQGWEILTAGPARWAPADFDGLTLMRRPKPGAPAPGSG